MTHRGSPDSILTYYIMANFRLITFFSICVITITYSLTYLNYENIGAVTCNKFRQISQEYFRSTAGVIYNVTDRDGPRGGAVGDNNNRSDFVKYVIGIVNHHPDSHGYQNRTYFDKRSGGMGHDRAFESNSGKFLHEGELELSSRTIGQSSDKDIYFSSIDKDKFTLQNSTTGEYSFHNTYNSSSIKSQLLKSITRDVSVDELSQILGEKIRIASSIIRKAKTKPGCVTNATIANSCDDNECLRLSISEDPKDRVLQLVTPVELQLSLGEISTLLNMRRKVSGFYNTVLLTGASSNHFLESQALLKNLHENIFPYLKDFVLVYYNLGLTVEERRQLVTFCKCTVVDFPFDELPEFVRNLKCYSWKPLMVKAHIDQGNVLVWMDASVRFQSIADFNQLAQRTIERGFQMAGPSEKSPFRTVRSMYHFFGDEPCAYLQMGQLHAGVGFFKCDPFVNRAILEPWTACALNKNCICPSDVQQKLSENRAMITKWRQEGGPIVYGQVHRFDQSAISLIIHKLFYKYYPYVLFDRVRHNVKFLRKDTVNYFPSIKSIHETP